VTKKYQWNTLTALGGRLIEVRDGYALAEMPLSEEVMQPTQVFHAGAIVVLADEAFSCGLRGLD
jgi:uncharacterized protein (TIGR00369 family)